MIRSRGFSVFYKSLLVIFLFNLVGVWVSQLVPNAVAQSSGYTFNGGSAQGWYMNGPMVWDPDLGLAGPVSSNFSLAWNDRVNYPSIDDPLDNSLGAITISTPGGHGIYAPGYTYWYVDFHSPDLSEQAIWSVTNGVSLKIYNQIGPGEILKNVIVQVYDEDLHMDRYFSKPSSADHLSYNSWTTFNFNWRSISTFPTNYTIKAVWLRCWGYLSGSYTGGIHVDDVMPLPVNGACCLDGDCDYLSWDDCQSFGGVFQGDGTTCASVVPAAASNCQASENSCTQIQVTWQDNSSDETGFHIYRDGEILTTVAANTVSYNDGSGAAGILHTYYIVAINGCGSASPSNQDTGMRLTIPAEATNCQASEDNCGYIRITWQDNSDNESGFYIYRNSALIDTTVADIESYDDMEASPGITYSYFVRAHNPCGPATPSNSDTGTALTLPQAASDCQASTRLCYGIEITWQDNSENETGFRIYRDDAELDLLDPDTESYLDETEPFGVDRTYTVVAVNECGEGEPSNPATGYARSRPAAASDCQASEDRCSYVRITWQDNSFNEVWFSIIRNGAPIDTIARDLTSYDDSTAVAGVIYSYSVRAWNSCGVADSSDTDAGTALAVPEAPSACDASTDQCDYIEVTWQDNSTDEEQFRISRDGASLAVVPANSASFQDDTANPLTPYVYFVTAESVCGSSEATDDAEGMRLGEPEPAQSCQASAEYCDFVRITWEDRSINESEFLVFREGTTIATLGPDVESYDDYTAEPGITYSYAVMASNECGGTSVSSDSGSRRAPPEAASDCQASSDRCDEIQITWQDNSEDETGFRIYRDDAELDLVAPGTESYLDETVSPGVSHTYAVAAVNECGEGTRSNSATGVARTLPTAASDCQASEDRCSDVRVTWVDNSTDETGFRIYRDGNELGLVEADTQSYEDESAFPRVSYEYAVVAVNDCGEAEPSNSSTGSRRAAPAAASNCQASDDLCSLIRVSWTDNSEDETGFRIIRDGSAVATVEADAESYEDSGGVPGFIYTYSVVAINDCGDAEPSNTDPGTSPGAALPASATDCQASDTLCDRIQVTWQDNSGDESEFVIFRDEAELARVAANLTQYDDLETSAQQSYTYWVIATNSCGDADPSNSDSGLRLGGTRPIAASDCDASDEMCDRVRVSWTDNSDDETGFRISRSGATLTTVGAGTELYDDLSATAGTEYTYAVVAINECGDADPSNGDSGTLLTVPAPASDCQASRDQCDRIHISWQDNSETETAFAVTRDGGDLATVEPNTESYDDESAEAGIIHVYSIVALNDCGRASPSNTVQGYRLPIPTAASECEASDDLCTYIHITWIDNSDNETGFVIYRDGTAMATVEADSESYDDTTAELGTFYSYFVVATSGCGDSDPSTADSGRCVTVPRAATGCDATDGLCQRIRVTWSDNSDDETGFEVLRDELVLGSVDSNVEQYDDETAEPNEVYTYSVVARNDCGASDPSNADSGRMGEGSPPVSASECQASDDLCGRIHLQWRDHSSDETGFQILRDGIPIGEVETDVEEYDDLDAVGGVVYQYAVVAVNDCGSADASNGDAGTRVPGDLPLAASACSATDGECDWIGVSWQDNSEDETGFRILRDGDLLDTVEADVESYDDTDALAGVVYNYSIVAANQCGSAEPSNTDTGRRKSLPAPASNCQASQDLPKTIHVSWQDNSENETGFRILRNGEILAWVIAGVTAYDDGSVSPSQVYEYAVVATNACGAAPRSNRSFGRLGPHGACCLVSNPCVFVHEATCQDLGGVYQGDGTDCETACSQPVGACCDSEGRCKVVSPDDCRRSGNLFDGSPACTPNPCQVLVSDVEVVPFEDHFEWQVETVAEAESVCVWYRQGGETDYELLATLPDTGDRWLAELPADAHSLRGIEYYITFQLPEGLNETYYGFPSDPKRWGVHGDLTLGDFVPLSFRMVSAPLEIDRQADLWSYLSTRYGPSGPESWMMGRWNPLDTAYVAVGQDHPEGLESGAAYWLGFVKNRVLPLSGETHFPPKGSSFFACGLEHGWNMVGNPACYALDLDRAGLRITNGTDTLSFEEATAGSHPWINSALYIYDPELPLDDPTFPYAVDPEALEMWEGCWIQNRSDSLLTLLLPAHEAVQSRPVTLSARGAPSVEPDWMLTLHASSGPEHALAVLGVSPLGSEEFDSQDLPLPPPTPGRRLALALRAPIAEENPGAEGAPNAGSWTTEGGKTTLGSVEVMGPIPGRGEAMLRDIRSDAAAPVAWDLLLSSLDDPVDLWWEEDGTALSSLDQIWSALLIDPTSEIQWDMHEFRSLQLPAGQYTLRILADRGPALPSEPQPLLLEVEPNPFSRRTVIRYTLPNPGRIILEIFDSAGSRVWHEEGHGLRAGSHAIVWTGQDDRSSVLPAGTYFARLRGYAGEGVEPLGVSLRKLILIR